MSSYTDNATETITTTMQSSSQRPASTIGTILGEQLRDEPPKLRNFISASILRCEDNHVPMENVGYVSESNVEENLLLNLQKIEQQTFKEQKSSSRSEGQHESHGGQMNHFGEIQQGTVEDSLSIMMKAGTVPFVADGTNNDGSRSPQFRTPVSRVCLG